MAWMQCRRYCSEEGLATHSRKPACKDDPPGIPAPILGAHSMCSPSLTWIPLGSLLVVQIPCGCRCFPHSKQRGTNKISPPSRSFSAAELIWILITHGYSSALGRLRSKDLRCVFLRAIDDRHLDPRLQPPPCNFPTFYLLTTPLAPPQLPTPISHIPYPISHIRAVGASSHTLQPSVFLSPRPSTSRRSTSAPLFFGLGLSVTYLV